MQDIILWIIQNKISLLACIVEILMILQCVHGIFKEKFKFTIEVLGVIVLDLIIMVLIYLKYVGQMTTVIVFIVLFIYCIRNFKRHIGETVKLFILSSVLVGVIEVFSSIVAIPVEPKFDHRGALMLFYNMIGYFLALMFFKIPQVKNRKIHLNFNKEKWGTLIIVSGVYVLVLLIDYRVHGNINQVYSFLFLLACVFACVTAILAQEAKHELDKRKLELELGEIYGDTYTELIAEVRRRQHDFTNQLSAIYSMHVTANSLEELIEEQRKYGDILLEKSRYDKILTGCNNSILAGYLYYKCVAYEQSNVKVDYQIHVDSAECYMPLHEIIEVLGILLTNAFESYLVEAERKCIRLAVYESLNDLTIEVSNISKALTTKEIEQIFIEGYSLKGKNRGLGLARLKELTSKTKADLIVENRSIDDTNWVNFRIVIPK